LKRLIVRRPNIFLRITNQLWVRDFNLISYNLIREQDVMSFHLLGGRTQFIPGRITYNFVATFSENVDFNFFQELEDMLHGLEVFDSRRLLILRDVFILNYQFGFETIATWRVSDVIRGTIRSPIQIPKLRWQECGF